MAGRGASTSHAAAAHEEDDDMEELECFGRFKTQVVGVRYYNGIVNRNEQVLLIREPQNPYDRWAIRVDNIRGEKVGHIARQQAAVLSPLIDHGRLRIEGLVQGAKGVYTCPIVMFCFGKEPHRIAVTNALRNGGIFLTPVDDWVDSTGEGGPGGSAAAGSSAGARMARLSQAELDNSLDRMFDDVQSRGPQPCIASDPEVVSALFPHQQVALAWMINGENNNTLPPFWEVSKRGQAAPTYTHSLANHTRHDRPAPLRGGILADDMGLGKTLTVIALIATNRPGATLPPQHLLDLAAPPPPAATAGAGTAAATAGAEATGSKTAGAGKKRGHAASKKATSYAEDDDDDEDDEDFGAAPAKKKSRGGKGGAAAAAGSKKKGEGGGGGGGSGGGSLVGAMAAKKLSKEQALAASLEPPPTVPAAGGPRATLIVCPLSVMSNWMTQIEEHTAGNLKVLQYHGPDRNRSAAFLADHDIVVTTYQTLAQEPSGGKRGLLAVDWLRVVCDEAHALKNDRTQQSTAARSLKAERRWAVTGTPVQNKLRDLYGLLLFLRMEALAVPTREVFARCIERPIKSRDPRAVKTLQVLMGSIALRRTKDMSFGGRPLVSLPPKTVNLVPVDLNKEDKDKYKALESEGQEVVAGHIRDNTLMEEFMNVLEIILRLRQVCDAGCLVPEARLSTALAGAKGKRAAGAPLSDAEMSRLLALLAAGGNDDCCICLAPMEEPCVTRCGHVFCRGCIEEALKRVKDSCPLCRAAVRVSDLIDAPLPSQTQAESNLEGGDTAGQAGASSAKVDALMARLRASASASSVSGRPAKSVVFSQFTGMMKLVEAALKREGLPYVRLDGSTSAKARADMLKAFASRDPGSPVVFLASLKAGGVGMNLTAAASVHMLEPWWNPAVEEQAMDRVHRLGQVDPVSVYRYIAKNTIEERMLELQERKRELVRFSFDRKSVEEVQRMRIDEIRLLMRV